MRPRLLPDIHLLPSEQGVVIRGPRHSAAIPMPGIYPWLERIRPFLDGSRQVEELVADLTPQAAQHVRALVDLLVREGFVRDAEGDLPHGLSTGVRQRHSALIDFIASRADSPEYRFERYRNCAPIVFGYGRMVTALVLALLASGVEYVRFWVDADGRHEKDTDVTRLEDCVDLLRREGRSFRYESVSGELTSLPADAGLTLLASDDFDRELTMRIHALTVRSGFDYGQAVASGQHAFISTLGNHETTSPMLRAAGTDGGTAAGEQSGGHLSGPTAALAANQLCLHVLRRVARLNGDEQPAADEAVLELATARFLSARPE